MKQVVSIVPSQRPYARHRLRLLGLMLTLAPFALAGEAQAVCTPAGSASNSIVVCSGLAVTNSGPDGVTGYGTGTDNNDTYTVSTTLLGDSFGLRTGTGGTLINTGTITGTGGAGINGSLTSLDNRSGGTIQGFAGISVQDISIVNDGSFLGTGAVQAAIRGANVTVTANTGLISGVGIGINAVRNATINNADHIEATGSDGVGIQVLTGILDLTNTANGTVAANNGTNSRAISGLTVNISNTGAIQATGTGGVAINATGVATISNTGG